jgi:hypothetical protein
VRPCSWSVCCQRHLAAARLMQQLRASAALRCCVLPCIAAGCGQGEGGAAKTRCGARVLCEAAWPLTWHGLRCCHVLSPPSVLTLPPSPPLLLLLPTLAGDRAPMGRGGRGQGRFEGRGGGRDGGRGGGRGGRGEGRGGRGRG